MLLGAALLGLLPPSSAGATVTLQPSADAGLPFWCDWGYDWDERCYVDDGPRLPIGGVDDKVWRTALRFSLAQVPERASVTRATLRLYHDGTCVAPRRTSTACSGRSYTVDAHRISGPDWFREREPALDERIVASARLPRSSLVQWLAWDVTSLVRAWHGRVVPNDGLLLKLADAEENFDVSGPYAPSASHPEAALRPRLLVDYTPLPG